MLTPILLRKSIITGGLLVFVDVMKELPITLILRPFNYETLATYVYQFAKDELLEETADLIYHVLVLLAANDRSITDVWSVLERRRSE